MIRASGDLLAARPDPDLERRLDGSIERIAAAQAKDPDGYLNTYTQLERPAQRWGLNGGDDNWQHDVHNAGAMIEAAVHYYRARGKARLLQCATRLANHMADLMGPPPKHNVVPGHSLAEEALVKLYLLFREQPGLKAAMPAQRLKAHPKVSANLGRVALQRRPLVYCLEAVDHGGHGRQLVILPEAPLPATHRPEWLGGVTVIEGPAWALQRAP